MSVQKKNNPSAGLISSVVWYAVVFFILIIIAFHEELNAWCQMVLGLFSPVLLGFAFAYILNPLFRLFERRIFSRMYPHSLRRAISLLCTYLSFLLAIALLLLMIVPQLFAALASFIANYQTHVDVAVDSINGLLAALNGFFAQTIGKDDFFAPIESHQIFDKLYKILEGYLEMVDLEFVTNTASAFFSAITDVIFALFISLYVLVSKERRYAQVMKIRNAIFSDSTNKSITRLCSTIDVLFGKFFEGRIIDSLIVGALLYLFFLIFGVPYAIILATFIALTNIVPYVGFFIGVIPSTLIVLFTDYEKLIPFFIICLIIFHFENNIISPKILGNNTGISSLCVIIAICVMSALFGFVGLLIAVPLFATLMDFGNSFIRKRLQKKRLPDDVENYYAPDPIIDPMEMNRGHAKNLITRLEKRVLRINKMIESGSEADVTATDRFCQRLYQLAKRMRIVVDTTPETFVQFSVDEGRKGIRKNTARTVSEIRAEIDTKRKEGEAI